MSAAHTPGPWYAKRVQRDDGDFLYNAVRDEGEQEVECGFVPTHSEDAARQRASELNARAAASSARLIAAAPQLAEALRELCAAQDETVRSGEWDALNDPDKWERARAALTAAGVTP